MKRILVAISILASLTWSCEDEAAFDAENLVELIIDMRVENNNQPGDGVSKIKVITVFPDGFTTEDDGKVTYNIFKEDIETIETDINSTIENGKEVRKSEVLITNNEADVIDVRATISVNKKLVFKEIQVRFKRAFPDSINIKSSSLVLTPNSFQEIELTTELLRRTGVVSKNSYAETIVLDTLGNPRGLFNNYKTIADAEGKIVNKYTLGTDDYIGYLYAISTTRQESNTVKIDTINLFSKE